MLGFMLMLYTVCDTLQGKPLLQHWMKSWKQVKEECLLYNLVGKALELVMKPLYDCFLLSYCRGFFGL